MADNRKFMADVSKFVDLTTRDMLAVAKESLQDVIRDAQTPIGAGGQMPVDTGFLRNSLTVEIRGSEAAKGDPDAGRDSETSNDAVTLGLAAWQLGDTFRVNWVAAYAIPRHYAVGVGQGGGLWRDKAAAKWSSIVTVNANKLRAMR
jgi:hypothetical protein